MVLLELIVAALQVADILLSGSQGDVPNDLIACARTTMCPLTLSLTEHGGTRVGVPGMRTHSSSIRPRSRQVKQGSSRLSWHP